MSSNPSTLPPASGQPRKPIEKRTLLLILGAILTVAVLISTVVSLVATSQPRSAQPGETQSPTAKNAVSSFSQDVNQARDVIAKNSEKAQKVAALASALHAQIPPCDDQMRRELAGRYYLLRSNSPDAPDVNLVCLPDNQWDVLPPAVGQVTKPTSAQADAESHATQTGALSPVEKRQLRLQAIYQSSPIPLHFADPDATPATAQPPAEPASPTAIATPQPAPVQAAANPKREELGIQLSSYAGPRYPLFQGRIIEGLLANRLMGEQGGPVKVQITTPVYSQDGQHLLIPPGSIVLGEAARVNASGEQRLAVVFHRIIMPDGWSFLLEPTKALDQQGAAGLTGKIDRHLVALISTAVMVGAIEGLADFAGVGSGSAIVEIQSGLSREGSNEAMEILRNALNRPPGISVYEGTRVRIWVAQDQALPGYESHIVKPTVE